MYSGFMQENDRDSCQELLAANSMASAQETDLIAAYPGSGAGVLKEETKGIRKPGKPLLKVSFCSPDA